MCEYAVTILGEVPGRVAAEMNLVEGRTGSEEIQQRRQFLGGRHGAVGVSEVQSFDVLTVWCKRLTQLLIRDDVGELQGLDGEDRQRLYVLTLECNILGRQQPRNSAHALQGLDKEDGLRRRYQARIRDRVCDIVRLPFVPTEREPGQVLIAAVYPNEKFSGVDQTACEPTSYHIGDADNIRLEVGYLGVIYILGEGQFEWDVGPTGLGAE
mmetsp:Transcript_27326/g.47165  ORF Transcript_27326/g.47165 Transcript_27326/m.47165 type:complete len:211 (-) Transcript_27326:439-1071(-)